MCLRLPFTASTPANLAEFVGALLTIGWCFLLTSGVGPFEQWGCREVPICKYARSKGLAAMLWDKKLYCWQDDPPQEACERAF